ncbi:MAG: hypothetical protein RIF34_03855 [Candidatus Kapaibacterium sp.]
MSHSEDQEELKIGTKLTENLVDAESAEKLKKKGTIFGIIIVIVLAAVGYYYYSASQSEKATQEAAMALSKILPEYDAGNYAIALDGGTTFLGIDALGLVDIANKYDGTNEGKLAALYAGNAYVNSNQYMDARNYFDKATDSKSDVVQSGGYAGLALCDEEDGKLENAAENYKKAAEKLDEDVLKSKYLYFAALNFEQAGKKDDAKNIYQLVVELSENSEFGNKSKVRLSMLGTKID